jgi:hypothetical protein
LPTEAQQQEDAGQCRDSPFHKLLLINQLERNSRRAL